MKRDILNMDRKVSGCCPGHDRFPDSTYKSRRSKKARSQGMKIERRYVRRVHKQQLEKEIK